MGTVIGRAAEDIWLHLDIDGDRGSADNWGWPWTPPTGNFMYLMPKEGSRVSLYFSNADERSGKGINCIAQTSGGNPRERWLKTEHKKSLNLKEEEMSLVSENGGNSIKMYGTGVYFKGQEITLSGKSINIDGSKVKLKANVDTILIGVGPMEEGKEGGCQLEPTAFVGLMKDELDICGKARTLLDAEAGSEGNPPYPDGPQEGKWNFAKAAGRAAVTVVVIGGTAVVVCASMGASTPVIAGAAVTAGMAGGGMMVSDAIQGKVSSLEDYALSVASAELMFFTNQAMTRLIAVTGMGFVSGTAAKAAGEAAAGAALDYLVAGEVDYERLARNLVINVVVDLGTGVLTGEAWEKPRQRIVEGGSKGGSKSGRQTATTIDYSYKFDRELANFNDGYEIRTTVDKDLILVQYSSDAPDASLCYWTTVDEANGITTLNDYMDKLALSKDWGNRNTVKVARISSGTEVKYAVGTAREQLLIADPRPGGGVQYLFNQFDTDWITEIRSFSN